MTIPASNSGCPCGSIFVCPPKPPLAVAGKSEGSVSNHLLVGYLYTYQHILSPLFRLYISGFCLSISTSSRSKDSSLRRSHTKAGIINQSSTPRPCFCVVRTRNRSATATIASTLSTVASAYIFPGDSDIIT